MANIDKLFSIDNGLSIDDSIGVFHGSSNPISTGFEAPIGSVYIRSDGTIYSKITSSDNGWILLHKELIAEITTIDNSYAEMLLSGTGNRLILPDDTTWAFRILISGRRMDANDESAVIQFVGGIDRNTGAGTTALISAPSKTIVARDVGFWNSIVDADTTNGSLRIQVRGSIGSTVKWIARIEFMEVTG